MPTIRLGPRSLIPLLVAVAALLGALATPAAAHSYLMGSNPADGATLAKPPERITLRFSEEIRAAGSALTTGGTALQPVVKGEVLTAEWPSAQSGQFRVDYRVVSIDGHVMTGEIAFRVSNGSRPAASAPAGQSSSAAQAAVPAAPVPSGRSGIPAWLWGLGALLVVLVVLAIRTIRRKKDR